MTMTPFELSLESELNIEVQRFANEWLFKWHGMTYEGGKTDVDDFRGGSIHYDAWIEFGHQQQQIYWQAIDRYLDKKIHETFKKWDVDTRSMQSSRGADRSRALSEICGTSSRRSWLMLWKQTVVCEARAILKE